MFLEKNFTKNAKNAKPSVNHLRFGIIKNKWLDFTWHLQNDKV